MVSNGFLLNKNTTHIEVALRNCNSNKREKLLSIAAQSDEANVETNETGDGTRRDKRSSCDV